MDQVLYEARGAVAWVTLNRPHVRNAQSRVLREQLDDAFARAVADDQIRVVVLAGAGDHFCSGHDLGSPEERADPAHRPLARGPAATQRRSWEINVANTLRWREIPKPTIAAVQGYCIFAGWMIASAMDLIVAADDALFLPGLVQYFSAPWDVGPRKAKEVLFQSRFVTAAEAHEHGFVNMVVPRDDLEAETMALASRIAATDPFVTRLVKTAVNQAQDAMGFRVCVEAAHSHYLVAQSAEAVGGRKDIERDDPRLPGVAQALRWLREGQ